MGGGTLSRHSPFGYRFEDVRALAFLRPQWGLAYDALFSSAWSDESAPDRPERPNSGSADRSGS
jgi:hypothetical protein